MRVLDYLPYYLGLILLLVLPPAPSAQQSPAGAPDYSDLTTGTNPVSRRVVRLEVPLVEQTRGPLCGPASIEMLFRFWGETRYSQYDIARSLVLRFRDKSRYRDNPVLREIEAGLSAEAVDWKHYPGTGTSYMREFLKPLAPTSNPRIESLPADAAEAEKIRDKFFNELKGHLDSSAPVIVHQWYNERRRTMHYRVVTGYDDAREIVFLNDPRRGRLEMKYAEFLELWKVERPWLPYNYIVFNAYAPGRVKRGSLRVDL